MKLVKGRQIPGDKIRFEKQVLWRIASQRQFGSQDDFRPATFQIFRGRRNLSGISREVTNNGIDLSEPDFHQNPHWRVAMM